MGCWKKNLRVDTKLFVYVESLNFFSYREIVFNLHEFEEKKIEFDDDGDRISTHYNIINLNSNKKINIGHFKSDSKSLDLDVNSTKIIWPGNTRQKPDGTKWSSKFKIVVIEEKPFIFKVAKPVNTQCNQIVNNSYECPWSYSNTFLTTFIHYLIVLKKENKSKNYCCYGYCIDLIKRISDKLQFEYELYLVPDSLYGDLVFFCLIDVKMSTIFFSLKDTNKQWNGLMGELVSERADLILAPFTINPERAQYVDFTKPFKYQGITILVKRVRKKKFFYQIIFLIMIE